MSGIGAFLAGFGPALAESIAQQRRSQQQDQLNALRMAEFQQTMQDRQRQQQAAESFMKGVSMLPEGGMGGMQPAAMPSIPTQSGQGGGGGMVAGGALTGDPLDLIAKYESGGRNIPQGIVPPGGGYNPSVGRVTGPSSAGGPWQIINPTWRAYAPKAGVDLAQYPTALSAPVPVQRAVAQKLFEEQGYKPWAPYNANLRAALARGGGSTGSDLAAGTGDFAMGGDRTAAFGGTGGPPDQLIAARGSSPTASPASYDRGRAIMDPSLPRTAEGRAAAEPMSEASAAYAAAVKGGFRGSIQDFISQRGSRPGAMPAEQQPAVPAPVQSAATDAARKTAPAIPQGSLGAMGLREMAQLIDRANPRAEPVVKMMALEKLQNFLAPQQKMQWEAMKTQHNEAFQVELMKLREEEIARRERDRPANAQLATEPTTGQPIIFDPKTRKFTDAGGNQIVPSGLQKLSTRPPNGDSKITEQEATLAAEQFLAGDATAMHGWGRGASGDENRVAIRRAVTKLAEARHMDGAAIANAMAEFQGQKAAQRTLGTREAGLGVALESAKKFAPIALAASENVDRTQFPSINSLILAAERGTGDENVVRLGMSLKALMAEYAIVLRRGGMPTDQSNREATALFDTAYSKGQLKAAIDQAMIEIDAAQKAPAAVRQQMRGEKGIKGASPEAGAAQSPAEKGAEAAYNSPEDVFRAIDQGTLQPEAAKKILIDKFGYKPQ